MNSSLFWHIKMLLWKWGYKNVKIEANKLKINFREQKKDPSFQTEIAY